MLFVHKFHIYIGTLFVLLLSNTLQALELNQKIKLEYTNPAWQYEKNFLSFEHVFLGEFKNNNRTIFSLTFTKIYDPSLDVTKYISKESEYYYLGRKDWLTTRGLKWFGEIKPKIVFNKYGLVIASIGFKYGLANEPLMNEITYYLKCQEELIHMKILFSEKNSKDLLETEKIIQHMDCKK